MEISGTYEVSSDYKKSWVIINAQIKMPQATDNDAFSVAFLFPFGKKKERTEVVLLRKKKARRGARSWEKLSTKVYSTKKSAR